MYLNWLLGDVVSIGVRVESFCGVGGNQFLYVPGYTDCHDMELYPTALNLSCSDQTWGTCLSNTNRTVVFYSCMNYHTVLNDVNCGVTGNYDKYYRELGRIATDSNGIAAFTHNVSSQDMADYNDAKSNGGVYNIVTCISDTLATTLGSVNFGNITIVQSLCYNVVCPEPICLNNKLYEGMCNPATGTCVADTTKLILDPCPTHFIEWNFSSLDSGFLNFLFSNITNLSNWLGTHLPAPSNIVYKKADYVNGKFRIYVNYTVPTGNYLYNQFSTEVDHLSLSELYDYNLKLYSPENEVMKLYNKYNDISRGYANINSLSPGIFDWITSGINLLLDTYARIISSVILFMIAGQFAIELGLGVGIVALIIAAAVSYYLIKDINFGTTTTGTPEPTTPAQNVTIVQEFVDTYIDPAADTLTPQCTCSPTVTPTAACTKSDMLFYLGGRATARYAQCLQAHANQGDATTLCDTVKATIESIKSNLTNGTITVQQACTELENNVVTVVKNDVTTVLQTIDCATNIGQGWAWNKDTQKCVKTCNVPILGQCLDTPLLIGGLLIGGYMVYKITKGMNKK